MANDREIIKERLNLLFQNIFEDTSIQISDETTVNDIEDWNSFNHITLLVAVENEFGLRSNLDETEKLVNIGVLIDILVERATK